MSWPTLLAAFVTFVLLPWVLDVRDERQRQQRKLERGYEESVFRLFQRREKQRRRRLKQKGLLKEE